MLVDDLNKIKDKVFINDKDVEEIIKTGEFELYKCIFMNDGYQIFIGDKYKDECDENEINDFVKKNLDHLKRKYSSVLLCIESKDINDDFINLLNIIPDDMPILIELSNVDKTNPFLLYHIINESSNKKLYLKSNISNYTLDLLLSISNAKVNNKLVKYDWNYEHSKNLYMQEDFNQKNNLDILIENTDNPKDVIEELNKIKILFQQNIIDNITINVNINDIHFFRAFADILYEFEGSDNWPDEKINYTLNVDKIEEQINYHDTRRFQTVLSKIQIKSRGILHDDYGKFQYFHNFIKFILSKIPNNATELEKVIYISKFIVEAFDYDTDNFDKLLDGTGDTPIRSFYDFASGGIGVCRDYADLTEYLLKKVGIRCENIGSTTYDYLNDKDIPGKIKLVNGNVVDIKYISHAFNLVYIDNVPYFIDNTWISKGTKLSESKYFLVSTDTFMKTHGSFVEVEKYNCPEDYSRDEISRAESMIDKYWSHYTDDDLHLLYSIGQYRVSDIVNDSMQQKR